MSAAPIYSSTDPSPELTALLDKIEKAEARVDRAEAALQRAEERVTIDTDEVRDCRQMLNNMTAILHDLYVEKRLMERTAGECAV